MIEVSARNISVRIRGKEIVQDVDFRAAEGRFTGLIGPNGSGKSTLLKCVYRALKPTGGAVFLGEKELASYSVREQAKRVGAVAQHNEIDFDFTVLEMTLMGRSPHKRALESDSSEDYRIAWEALRMTGLEAFADRPCSDLSGGERQQAIAARAIAQQTDCLILDEPTNHLDICRQLELMGLLKKSGRTVIAAFHDLNLAARYCDYLYVMLRGRIYAQGPPEDLLTEPLIREVYGVGSRRVPTEDGYIHIIFLPD
ncbi:MAG: ABC transporter ATP-binding protein [Spirochaetaceae bacterium]|jgi:iron complex transport system ATP-binding protein|nr:ABC transporter ATP-binding protein [Spirochaetaceae bacterium]